MPHTLVISRNFIICVEQSNSLRKLLIASRIGMVQVTGHLAVDNLSGSHYRQSIFSYIALPLLSATIAVLQMPSLLSCRRTIYILLTQLIVYPIAGGVACPLPLNFSGQGATSHLDNSSVEKMVTVLLQSSSVKSVAQLNLRLGEVTLVISLQIHRSTHSHIIHATSQILHRWSSHHFANGRPTLNMVQGAFNMT